MKEAIRIDGRDIPIVIDTSCEHIGVVRWNVGFTGRATTPRVIELREWNERVLLHEALHCLLGDNEDIVRRATELYEVGWRFGPDA